MSKNKFLVVLFMIAALAFFGCAPEEEEEVPPGETDGDQSGACDNVTCEDANSHCVEGICVCKDGFVDCGEDFGCLAECPCEEDLPCLTGEDCCPNSDQNCHADLYLCMDPECEGNADCETLYPGEGNKCNTTDNFCYVVPCKSDADCDVGFYCSGGGCVEVIPCENAASIGINEGSGLINEGENINLSATSFNTNGARLGSCTFNWESNDTDKVTVDAATGVITGGTTNGEATITAKLADDTTILDTVTYINFQALTAGNSRVVVYDDADGSLIADADVYLAIGVDPAGAAVVTDGGIAAFDGVDCATNGPCNLHVFHENYNYISAFGVAANDILLPLTLNADNTIATGVKGEQDPSPIPEAIVGNNDTRIGITMFSIPGVLADMNFESLLGEMMPASVVGYDIELPAGLELLMQEESIIEGRDGFMASGLPGKGTLWGLGGYAKLNDILSLVMGAIGDEIDIPAILGAVVPLFEQFWHAIVPGYDLPALPKVADTGDINGNGDFDELVPDYAQWEDIGKDLKLNQALTQNANLNYGDLPPYPDVDSGCADAVVSLIGAMQSGVGFIPLGLNIALDAATNEETPNCKVGLSNDGVVPAVFAPQHGGVEGYDYFVVSLALSLETLMGSIELKADPQIDLSGVISRSAASPDEVDLPDFLGFMSDAAWATDTRTLTNTAVAGADFNRVVTRQHFEDAGASVDEIRYWHIYWPGDGTGFTLPNPTTLGVQDRLDGATLIAQAFKLENSLTYADLLGFNSTNINNLNDLMAAFSAHAMSGGDSADCNSTGSPYAALPLFLLLALLPIMRRRFN